MPVWVSFGWMSSAGILVIEQRQQRGADDDPEAELDGARERAGGARRGARQPCREPPFLHVTGSFSDGSPGPVGFGGDGGSTVDDGVRVSATIVDGPGRRARAAPGARVRRRQGGLRRPPRRARAGPSRGHVRPPGPRRERRARRSRGLLARPAGRRHARGRRRAPASTISACSATRWAAWSRAGSCSRHPDRSHALGAHGHLGRPAARARPRAGRLRRRGRGAATAWRVLKRLHDELDPLGSPAHQRVLAERPGFREYADRKWARAVAGDVERMSVEMVTAARPARRARRRRPARRS